MKKIKYYSILIGTILFLVISLSSYRRNLVPTNNITFDVDTTYQNIDSVSNYSNVYITDSSLSLMQSINNSALLTIQLVPNISVGSYVLDSTTGAPCLLYFDNSIDLIGKSITGNVSINIHDTITKHIQGTFSGHIKYENSSKTRTISNGFFDVNY